MQQLITINNVQVPEILYRDQRVVTFEMIAQVHGISVENVRQSFKRHQEYFLEEKHFYRIDFNEASQLVLRVPVSPNGMMLFTERGYLKLTKPMRDETSWYVQDQFIDDYFALRAAVQEQVFAPASPPQLTPHEKLAEIIACVTLADDYLQSIGQLNSRDRLMSADMVRTAKLRVDVAPAADAQLALPSPEHFDVADRVKALGYTLTRQQQASLLPVIGKAVAAEYRTRYDKEPESTNRFVDGKVRPVRWYTHKDTEWLDTVIQVTLAQHGVHHG